MIRSTDHIRTMHAGTLPRPPELLEMVVAKSRGEPVDEPVLTDKLRTVIAENVGLQLETGIDSVNDGEVSKVTFTSYISERMSGIERRTPRDGPAPPGINGRDMWEFSGYFAGRGGFTGSGSNPSFFCVGPIAYSGQAAIQADIDNFNAGLRGYSPEEAFLPAVTPGTMEHWLANEYYPSDEAFLFALADALHEEYKAIVDAGFLLQIDDPDLPDGWQMNPDMSVAEYRKFADLRIEALNHAIGDIPEDKVRFHTCWGSYKGPHKYDIPLADIADLILKVKAVGYSIEASNPAHEHEWTVWRDVNLPDGKVLIPGVIGHASDFIEHPQLVAQRLLRYADIVGRENVMAGTDCGIGSRVGHAKVCWEKFRAMSEGARIASEQLWG
jgi:5-methyltetrahydropteroyltriglutamate--homocysteine methyltransferase